MLNYYAYDVREPDAKYYVSDVNEPDAHLLRLGRVGTWGSITTLKQHY